MLHFGFLKHFCQDFIFFLKILMPQSCLTSFTAETGSNWKQKQFCKTWKISVKSCTIQQNFIWKNLSMKKIRNFHGKSVKESNQEKISWNQSPLFCLFMKKFQKLDQEFCQMRTFGIFLKVSMTWFDRNFRTLSTRIYFSCLYMFVTFITILIRWYFCLFMHFTAYPLIQSLS